MQAHQRCDKRADRRRKSAGNRRNITLPYFTQPTVARTVLSAREPLLSFSKLTVRQYENVQTNRSHRTVFQTDLSHPALWQGFYECRTERHRATTHFPLAPAEKPRRPATNAWLGGLRARVNRSGPCALCGVIVSACQAVGPGCRVRAIIIVRSIRWRQGRPADTTAALSPQAPSQQPAPPRPYAASSRDNYDSRTRRRDHSVARPRQVRSNFRLGVGSQIQLSLRLILGDCHRSHEEQYGRKTQTHTQQPSHSKLLLQGKNGKVLPDHAARRDNHKLPSSWGTANRHRTMLHASYPGRSTTIIKGPAVVKPPGPPSGNCHVMAG